MYASYANCCGPSAGPFPGRRYITKEERKEWLREYQQELQRELEGVKERLKELEA